MSDVEFIFNWNWLWLILFCFGYFLTAGLAINVGYHRCLSHRSFRLKKWLERTFITLGLPAGTPVQWTGNHRFHHRHADDSRDPHSPIQCGFWHAHVGWYIGSNNPFVCAVYSLAGPLRMLFDGWNRPRTNQQHNALAADVATDRYYNWISQPAPFFAACLLHALIPFGLVFLLWGLVSIAALWATLIAIYNIGDSIDSFAHIYGDRPFKANHLARNNRILGYLALGEGWHANHHTFPGSARHGLLPGQFDGAWLLIRLLNLAGLADSIVLPDSHSIRQRLLKKN
jgi:stearoyl-CoA desaturase (delta-9 desaturase)